jgi:hypothetical protein
MAAHDHGAREGRSARDFDVAASASAALRPDRNVFVIHCRQTGDGQHLGLGMVDLIPAK